MDKELQNGIVISEQEKYQLERSALLRKFASEAETGLAETEVLQRRALYGENAIAAEDKAPFWQKILDQFKDFMIIILIVAALVSGVLGEIADAVIIIAIVVVNAILGVIQEGKAEKAIAALQKMSAPNARVLRDGQQKLVPAVDLVLGDIVVLEAGDIVPADIRLLRSSNLKAEEASLTGESVPVEKEAEFESASELGLGDRDNMLYASTSITYGTARGLVVATGDKTEVGKIADRLKGIQQTDTPLQQSLNHLGKTLGVVCIVVCAIVFLVGLLQGGNPMQLFLTAVSLAVAAIPEGLPAVVTIVLALGMNRMAAEHAIVKRLLAVETLGSIDTICSDKTGTLTQNEMTVTRLYCDRQVYEVSGSGYAPQGEIKGANTVEIGSDASLQRLLEIAALCNEAELSFEAETSTWRVLGDPTEGALLTLAAKRELKRSELQSTYQYSGDLPFDSKRKMMSVFYKGFAEGNVALSKGAPDILLALCKWELRAEGVVELTELRREEILANNTAFARQALRVLAFAYTVHPAGDFARAEQDMIFVGLSGMIDPSRPEAKEAIAVCHGAGIRVVMITGDYADTAVAIGKELNLFTPGDGVLSGLELENMSDAELEAKCEHVSIYARVSPEHKVRIVAALRNRGHAASMTGDGVNDAPALKQADIGVAMGITGTEVAKGSADMILTDDNFATIVSAVKEGRIIYSNIRKFVGFLLSCNVGEILVIFITNLLLGPQHAPLLPIQLLWLNLVTDSFPALALGQEKGEADIMLQKPRLASDKIINKEMILSVCCQALAIFVAVFLAFQIGRYLYPDYQLIQGEPSLLAGSTTQYQLVPAYNFFADKESMPSNGARTFAFVTLITAELLRAFSSRSERRSVFSLGLFSNKTMNRSILISFVMMLLVVFVPALDALFKTITPNWRDWLIIVSLAFIPFSAGETFKYLYHKSARK